MSNDSGSPLALIKAILERHQSNLQPVLSTGFSENSAPIFDPRVLGHSQRTPQTNIAQRVSSWGLPEFLSAQIIALLSNESAQLQGLVEQTRRKLLEQLMTSSVSPNPSTVPALVESTCTAVYQSAIDSVLLGVQKQIESFSLDHAHESDGDDMESDEDVDSSTSEENDDVEDEEAFNDHEQDEDNSPIKPGEEVPPLEIKYLPIFEALHERGKVLTKPEKTYLVNMTGMTYRQITIWFQNRRRGELKEDQARATSSFAASALSDEPSDSSDDEFDLEKRVSNLESDATFNIRSWCLASAAAAKSDGSFPSLPTSPIKLGFGPTENIPEFDSDGSDLSDTDDEMEVPPGLRVPSLTTSATTLDSSSERGPLTSSFIGVPNHATGTSVGARPIKNLPGSRRNTPPVTSQTQGTFSFSLNLEDPSAGIRPSAASSAPSQPQAGFFTPRGTSAEPDYTPPASTATFRPPQCATSAPIDGIVPAPPAVPPLSGPSADSPPRNISPTPSSHSSSSPRPPTKPLPRRTGCAPRPRPPPRAASTSTQIQTPSSSNSTRPSIILPPSSNPSLTGTTLGALLRPNPPGPTISPEMEVRLSAMAGRMGVGASSSPESAGKSRSAGVSSVRSSITGHGTLLNRGGSFSFGSATLPKLASLPESTQASSSRPSSHTSLA